MYGKIGILNYDNIDDRVECHICGRWYRRLGKHVQETHRWTPEEYKEEFGLNRHQSLSCEGERVKNRERNINLGLWRYLKSQTSTKDELVAFLDKIRPTTFDFRPQEKLLMSAKSKHLRDKRFFAKSLAARKRVWYNSPEQKIQSRLNQQAAVATRRRNNLEIGKWLCSCGEAFATRENLRAHRKNEILVYKTK